RAGRHLASAGAGRRLPRTELPRLGVAGARWRSRLDGRGWRVKAPRSTTRAILVPIAVGVLTVSLALVAAKLAGIDVGLGLRRIREAPASAMLFALASAFVVLGLQALRWYSVMGPIVGLPYADAFRAQVVGQFLNAVLPARAGDILRVQYLGLRSGKSRATILGTEIVDRWLDWWGWLPTFAVLALVSSPPYWVYRALVLFGGTLCAWGALMVVLTKRGYRPRPGSRLGRLYASVQIGLSTVRSHRLWLIAFFVAPLPWLWEAIAIVVTAHGFGIQLSFVMAFSVIIGFNLAMVVPSPGAVGA